MAAPIIPLRFLILELAALCVASFPKLTYYEHATYSPDIQHRLDFAERMHVGRER